MNLVLSDFKRQKMPLKISSLSTNKAGCVPDIPLPTGQGATDHWTRGYRSLDKGLQVTGQGATGQCNHFGLRLLDCNRQLIEPCL